MYEEYDRITKFPVEVIRVYLVYDEYGHIMKFSVEVVRIFLA